MGPQHDECAKWTLLGTFAGAALGFVRELLQGEGVTHREAPLPARDSEPHAELWVATDQHERAAALLAAAQADAESAAQRETAALAADEARAATEAARAAAEAARLHAAAGRHAAHAAARRAAKEALRAARRAARHARRQSHAFTAAVSDSRRGMRIFGGTLVVFILTLVLISVLGERFGTRRPSPGHTGKTVTCRPRQVICY